MDSPDPQFRIGVLVGGAVLVGVIMYARFCGSLSLPPKPPEPSGPTGTQRQLLTKSTSSPGMYQDFLERDSASAGVRVPTLDEMSRKLSYRVDEARHVLEPGHPAIEAAGLRLRVERSDNTVVMIIQNLLGSDVAYEVTTTPSAGAYVCNSARPLPINAMVIAKGGSETRTECAWRDGMSIVVTKVETVEVGPLSSYYLSQVPPDRRRDRGSDRARSSRRRDQGALLGHDAASGADRAGSRRYRVERSRRLLCSAPMPDLPVSIVISSI